MNENGQRVNKEDYPAYRKDTKSAESFREAFKNAKEAGKDSFSFEGRTYNTEEKTEMAKGGMVKAISVIPHSDVFFVRAALEKRTGIRFQLHEVEAAMKAEGWSEGRILKSDHRYKGNKNV